MAESTEPAEGSAFDHIVLPAADTLTLEGASQHMRQHRSRMVAILGPHDAGKTSLIASAYDLFQSGNVGPISFARSDTLHGFELACHDARAASRRIIPEQIRTPLGEVRFYHVDVAGGPAGRHLTLLLGDRAGEEYLDVANDISLANTYPEILRADVLTVLVDGARLVDAGARHNARTEIRLMLQAFAEGGGLSRRKHLAIVQTKHDLVVGSAVAARVASDMQRLVDEIARDLPNQFARTATFATAASPADGTLARGTGVPELLDYWLTASPTPSTIDDTAPSPSRAFGRLSLEGGVL